MYAKNQYHQLKRSRGPLRVELADAEVELLFSPQDAPIRNGVRPLLKNARKRIDIVGRDKLSASGFLDDLGERAAPGLDDRDAACHRLEEKHSLRLVVRCRNRQHVQRAQERELTVSIDGTAVGEFIA